MGRELKWPNPELWEQVASWKSGGLTYSQICGRLSSPEYMKKFHLEVVPSEDTLRRDLQKFRDSVSQSPRGLLVSEPATGWWGDGIRHGFFATLEVAAVSAVEPECWAQLRVLDPPVQNSCFILHWAGVPYDPNENAPVFQTIAPGLTARLDLAFVPLEQQKYSPTRPILSGQIPQLLQSLTRESWDGTGCWIAQPLALYRPLPGLPAFLPPGEYPVQLTVFYRKDMVAFQADNLLKSPQKADQLQFAQKLPG